VRPVESGRRKRKSITGWYVKVGDGAKGRTERKMIVNDDGEDEEERRKKEMARGKPFFGCVRLTALVGWQVRVWTPEEQLEDELCWPEAGC
jgi:hypothetical protein